MQNLDPLMGRPKNALNFPEDQGRVSYLRISLFGRDDSVKQKGLLYSSAISPEDRKKCIAQFDAIPQSRKEDMFNWATERKKEQEAVIRRSGVTPAKLRKKLNAWAKEHVRSLNMFTADDSLRTRAKELLGLADANNFKSYDCLPGRYGKMCTEVAQYWTVENGEKEARRRRDAALKKRRKDHERKVAEAIELFESGGVNVKTVADKIGVTRYWVYKYIPKDKRKFVTHAQLVERTTKRRDARQMDKLGYSKEDICEYLQISRTTLWRYLR